MGQPIENNDTLKINDHQVFPGDVLSLEKYHSGEMILEDISNMVFEFQKPGFRIYHQKPTRCFLVEERENKRIYWGHIEIFEQIHLGESEDSYVTKGKYKITKLFAPEDQEKMTNYLSKQGKSYF